MWIVFSLISPLLSACVNHIDKYLIEKYFKRGEIGSLVIFSAIAGLPVAAVIGFLHRDILNIQSFDALFLMLTGVLFISGIIPYFYALEKDEATIVSPLTQMIPVISFILGFIFLGETVNTFQLFGSIFIISGAVILSLEVTDLKKLKVKKEILGLMFLCSLFLSLTSLMFKVIAIDQNFWTSIFWEYMGFFIASLFLLVFLPSYRNQFISVLKQNKLSILSLNILNEVLADIAKISLNMAVLLAPIAIVASISEGVQPLFVLVIGVLITKFWPHVSVENLSKKHLIHKSIAIGILIFGVYLIAK